MSDPIYDKEQKQQDGDSSCNEVNGFMTSIIFGEVINSNLSYDDVGLARLNLVISSRMPFKKFSSGFKDYKNRITVWGRDAEVLARVIEVKDDKNNKCGTFILCVCRRFGGEKYKENWTHTFSCSQYRIVKNPKEFITEIGDCQDTSIINLNSLLGLSNS